MRLPSASRVLKAVAAVMLFHVATFLWIGYGTSPLEAEQGRIRALQEAGAPLGTFTLEGCTPASSGEVRCEGTYQREGTTQDVETWGPGLHGDGNGAARLLTKDGATTPGTTFQGYLDGGEFVPAAAYREGVPGESTPNGGDTGVLLYWWALLAAAALLGGWRWVRRVRVRRGGESALASTLSSSVRPYW